MNRPLREARDVLRELIGRDPDDGMTYGLIDRARAVLAKLERKPAPRKALPGKSRATAKKEKKATRKEQMQFLRNAALVRAADHCELCSFRFGFSEAASLMPELHHLDGGSGRRRQRQSLANVAMVHVHCHREWHRGDRHWPSAAPHVRAWLAARPPKRKPTP